MKRITGFFVAFLLSFAAFAQSKAEIIKSIKTEFQIINSDTAYTLVRLDNEELTDEMPDRGCSLTGYYKDGKIRKMVEWFGVSNGIYITEYYFKDSQLIFVYEEFKTFDFDIAKNEFNYDKPVMKYKNRYYFNNKKLIERIAKPEDATNKDLVASANENLLLLRKKK